MCSFCLVDFKIFFLPLIFKSLWYVLVWIPWSSYCLGEGCSAAWICRSMSSTKFGKISDIISFFFLRIYLFIWERVGENRRGGAEGENHKRLPPEDRAWCRAWSHHPEMMTWAKIKSQTLNWAIQVPPNIISSNTLSFTLSFPSYFGIPNEMHVDFCHYPPDPWDSVNFFWTIFFLLFRLDEQSTVLSSNSLILSSAISTLLLNPFSEFLFLLLHFSFTILTFLS